MPNTVQNKLRRMFGALRILGELGMRFGLPAATYQRHILHI